MNAKKFKIRTGYFFTTNQSQDAFSRFFDEEELARFADQYSSCFKLRTKSSANAAFHYLSGLFLAECGKRNIERMSEKNRQSYQSQHHFLSEPPWSAQDLMRRIGQDINQLPGDCNDQCLSIDESSNGKAMEQEIVQMLKRYQQRQNDIERYYKTQT